MLTFVVMKDNTKSIPITTIFHMIPSDIPIELAQEISTWERVIKSPYGHSYYDSPVSWDFKADKSLRIADHWNFTAKNKKHCCTTTECPNNTHWTIARFDESVKKYVVIKSYLKESKTLKNTFEFRLLLLTALRQKAIRECKEHVSDVKRQISAMSRLELNYLNKYFKIMEESLVN